MKRKLLILIGMVLLTLLLTFGSLQHSYDSVSKIGWLSVKLFGIWYTASLLFFSFYPLYQFKKFFSGTQLVEKLPVSKKRLFFKKVVTAMIACLLWTIFIVICYAVAHSHAVSIPMRVSLELIGAQAFLLLWVTGLINMVVMAITIYCLSKQKRIAPYVIGFFVINVIYISLGFSTIDHLMTYCLGLTVFIVIVFLISLKNIEKIAQ